MAYGLLQCKQSFKLLMLHSLTSPWQNICYIFSSPRSKHQDAHLVLLGQTITNLDELKISRVGSVQIWPTRHLVTKWAVFNFKPVICGVTKPHIIVCSQNNSASHKKKKNQSGTSACAFSLICHRVMQIQAHIPSLAKNGSGSLKPTGQVFIILLLWFSTRPLTDTYMSDFLFFLM